MSAPYSVMMIGLPCLAAQAAQLRLERRARRAARSPGVDVPAVVAVEHHDVEQVGDDGRSSGGASMHVDEADRPRVGSSSRVSADERLEVARAPRRCATRARWRCSTARRSGGSCRGRPARAIACAVRLAGGVADRLLGERSSKLGRRDTRREPEVEADRRPSRRSRRCRAGRRSRAPPRRRGSARCGTSSRRSSPSARSRAPSARRRGPCRGRRRPRACRSRGSRTARR